MNALPADFSEDPPDMTPEEQALQSKLANIEMRLRQGAPVSAEERLLYRRALSNGDAAPVS